MELKATAHPSDRRCEERFLKKKGDREAKPQTWREPDVGDDVLAVVEGHQVLQGVRVDDEEAAVVQAHRQGLAVGGEAAAAATCGG